VATVYFFPFSPSFRFDANKWTSLFPVLNASIVTCEQSGGGTAALSWINTLLKCLASPLVHAYPHRFEIRLPEFNDASIQLRVKKYCSDTAQTELRTRRVICLNFNLFSVRSSLFHSINSVSFFLRVENSTDTYRKSFLPE
jgi:hypothetical protein